MIQVSGALKRAAAGGRKAHLPRPGSERSTEDQRRPAPHLAGVLEPARQRDQVHPRGWDVHAVRAAARRGALGHDRGYGTRDRPGRSRAHIRSLLATQAIGRSGNGARALHRAGNRGGAWRTRVGRVFSQRSDLRLHVAARTAPRLRARACCGELLLWSSSAVSAAISFLPTHTDSVIGPNKLRAADARYSRDLRSRRWSIDCVGWARKLLRGMTTLR